MDKMVFANVSRFVQRKWGGRFCQFRASSMDGNGKLVVLISFFFAVFNCETIPITGLKARGLR